MTDMSARTLSMAIRCVNMELTRVAHSIQQMGEEASADGEEELMLLSQAAAELKAAYLQKTATAENLVSYEELIRESTIAN